VVADAVGKIRLQVARETILYVQQEGWREGVNIVQTGAPLLAMAVDTASVVGEGVAVRVVQPGLREASEQAVAVAEVVVDARHILQKVVGVGLRNLVIVAAVDR